MNTYAENYLITIKNSTAEDTILFWFMRHERCFKEPSTFDNDIGFEEYLVCYGAL